MRDRILQILVAAIFCASSAHVQSEIPENEYSDVVDYKRYLRIAVGNHPEIQFQYLEIEKSSADIREAKSQRLPSVSIGGGLSDVNQKNSNYGITLPIFTFNKISSQIDLNSEKKKLEEYELIEVINRIALDLTATFQKYKSVTQRIHAYEVAQVQLSKMYKRIKRRADIGFDSQGDLFSIESKQMKNQAAINSLLVELEDIKKEISSYYGSPIGELAPLPENYFEISIDDEFPILLENQNPRLLIANQKIIISERQKKVNRANELPTLEAYKNGYNRDILNTPNDQGFRFSYRLDNLGVSALANDRKAELEIKSSREELRRTHLEIQIELDRIDSSLRNTSIRQQEQKNIFNTLTSIKESYLRQYEVGLKSINEVLNVDSEIIEARLSLIREKEEEELNKAKLYALIGGFYSAIESDAFPDHLEMISK